MNKIIAMLFLVVVFVVCSGCTEKFGVKSVSPSTGLIGGGEPVVIQGSGFNPNMGITVYFGTSKSPKVSVGGTDNLTVITPPSEKTGVVDIRIATDDGKEYLLKNVFRYVEKGVMDIREIGTRKSLREKP